MDWPAVCAAVIPCLNEGATVGPLVEAVRGQVTKVIVVDDGSSDGTARIAEQAGAEVLSHPRSCGKGAALQTGWRHARQGGYSWALSMDGDAQHAPTDIPLFFRCAETTSARLVVGNRLVDPARMPWLRRRVNRWMSRRLSKLAGQQLPDSQCGFRLMYLKDWARLPIRTEHFEIESEVLLAFAAAAVPIEFVPIQAIYKHEQSKIHPWRDSVRWLRWWGQVSRTR